MKKSFVLLLSFVLTGLMSIQTQASSLNNRALHAQVARTAFQAGQLASQKDPYRAVLLERFLRYVSYNSQSQEYLQITTGQIETANKLFAEIKQMGFAKDVTIELSAHHYIFVNIPSNQTQKAPILGFSAHYDVTPDLPAENVHAQVIKNYQGQKIELGVSPQGEKQVLDPSTKRDQYLNTQIGKLIVTSDGTTNLGADDKAGIAILMTMLKNLADNPKKLHGQIQVVLAPNEDVGRAAQFIEEINYHPEIAFDFDGGSNGEIMCANFNARQTIFTIQGHPGHQSAAATNGYLNAWTPACELGAAICTEDLLPNHSTGEQGYVELHHMFYDQNNVSTAKMDIRQRGYDSDYMDKWEQKADSVANATAAKYGVAIGRQTMNNYNNVAEVAHAQTRAVAERACKVAGVTPNFISVRAGTTAAMFVTKGLVGAYTIFTGQNNEHSFVEWLSEDDMYKSYLVALNIVDQVAKLGEKK